MAASGLLGACGFQPLYGVSQATAPALKAVRVAEIAGRVGFTLRNALIRELRIDGAEAPRQELRIGLQESAEGLAIQRDDTITRYNYRLVATYQLVSLDDGKTLTEGRTEGIAAYNVVDSQFATLIARRDVEARAARDVATDIRLRLSMFFATGEGRQG
ncbi:LPS assembly lipoprotein LptE [Futiania mangrovi]|uniref:LPS assembly lipoprotein LptE n=1 Tax=Futiania mangrovi TaxID=2959716 RepID=A0A9J6PFA2_9PROT|nr:LPS assembly lipoprotein LptE [Futiania mangrovii]MCP1336512.1 LPS assembly lipoprotein LptE [Futiania mangrovii]